MNCASQIRKLAFDPSHATLARRGHGSPSNRRPAKPGRHCEVKVPVRIETDFPHLACPRRPSGRPTLTPSSTVNKHYHANAPLAIPAPGCTTATTQGTSTPPGQRSVESPFETRQVQAGSKVTTILKRTRSPRSTRLGWHDLNVEGTSDNRHQPRARASHRVPPRARQWRRPQSAPLPNHPTLPPRGELLPAAPRRTMFSPQMEKPAPAPTLSGACFSQFLGPVAASSYLAPEKTRPGQSP